MEYSSTTPYMIRAIHEWCVDNSLTPHLLVEVSSETKVPLAYVKDGEVVLNLSYGATKGMQIENDYIAFSARFGGVSQELYIPIEAVKGIFARENGQGMFFEAVEPIKSAKPTSLEVVDSAIKNTPDGASNKKKSKKPTLKVVK